MKTELKYIALVPSYQPDENLPRLVKELKENNFVVIVINDGSDISYENIFNECDTKTITYPTNRGKGYALKKGIEYIKNNYENYIVVTIDSDGQHKVDDAIKLCDYVRYNKDTLTIGKRMRKDNVPVKSRIGNIITRYIFHLATNENIYDTQSGLRAFSEELSEYMLEIEGNRFEYEINVLLHLKENNIKHKEIEIQTIYIDNNKRSHFKILKDSFKIYNEIIKFKAVPTLAFLIDLIIFAILIIGTSKIVISNIISKIISIITYYVINRKEIFKDKLKLISIIKQIGVLSLIILISTLLLLIISRLINTYIAKVLTETILVILIDITRNKINLQ